jgi:predicted transcriptional regulator of viral defense system
MRKVEQKLIKFIKARGGYIRPKDLEKAGYDPDSVYRLRRNGVIERVGWGLYRLIEHPVTTHIAFVEVSQIIPKGVICLRSALSNYELTTYNPSRIDVAIPRYTRRPKSGYPPIEYWEFSNNMFSSGIEEIEIDEVTVKIYGPEKTICDCFRFRNKIGIDLAKEGLREYLKRKDRDINKLLKYAEICRIRSVLRPYLEAML